MLPVPVRKAYRGGGKEGQLVLGVVYSCVYPREPQWKESGETPIRENPLDLLLEPRQFGVAIGGGESVFAAEGTDVYGAGREQIAIDTWRMLVRRMLKTANSVNKEREQATNMRERAPMTLSSSKVMFDGLRMCDHGDRHSNSGSSVNPGLTGSAYGRTLLGEITHGLMRLDPWAPPKHHIIWTASVLVCPLG